MQLEFLDLISFRESTHEGKKTLITWPFNFKPRQVCWRERERERERERKRMTGTSDRNTRLRKSI